MRFRRRFTILGMAIILIGLGAVAVIAPAQEKLEDSSSVEETRPNEDPLLKAIGQSMVGEPDESIQKSREESSALPSMKGLFLRTIGALLITLLVLYVALKGLKRFMGQQGMVSTPHIQVIGKTYLSPKTIVYLIEVAGQVLVVGDNPNGITLLTTIENKESLMRDVVQPNEGDLVASWKPSSKSGLMADFMNQLGRFRTRQGSEHLSKKLRESTQVANLLKNRIGEPESSKSREDVVGPRK